MIRESRGEMMFYLFNEFDWYIASIIESDSYAFQQRTYTKPLCKG